jgi:hypothetical protein
MNFELLTVSYSNSPRASLRLVRSVLSLIIGLSLSMGSLYAAEPADPLTNLAVIPDQELAGMRGGFITADGLEVNLGFQQLVMINGTLKTTLNMDLTGLGGNSKEQANALQQSKMIQLIQNGDHNLVSPDIANNFSAGALTLIQNSLDTQLIQNFNVINVDVSKFSQFRNNALGQSLNLEMVRSLR